MGLEREGGGRVTHAWICYEIIREYNFFKRFTLRKIKQAK